MKERISKKDLRKFGLLIGFGFPILLGWLIPAITGHGFRAWTLWVGFPGFIFGLISPSSLQIPYKVWMMIGHVLGWVNSRIILGIIFFIVLLPIAMVMRLFGYDPLKRNRKGKHSYRVNSQNDQIELTRIF